MARRKTGGVSFKAESNYRRRWTNNIVPYEFAPDTFRADEIAELLKAMDILSELTCVSFRERQSGDENYVYFQDNGSGCNSQLGMMGYGKQTLNLDNTGCRWRGLYIHEIGHALGLIHEHQRPDRDSHVRVIWRRVKKAYIDAFTKYADSSVNDYGIEYDPSSVMHYGEQAFNDDYEVTTVLTETWKRSWLSRVYFKTLSWTDTKVLNKMYNCDVRCDDRRRQQCAPSGYLDKNCQCITPQDIYNRLCVNELPDRECENRVLAGDCTGGNSGETNIKCRKSCGSCPMYGRDRIIRAKLEQPLDAFIDRWHDEDKCRTWASQGKCQTNAYFMNRQCRRSCGARDYEYGKCLNLLGGLQDDRRCDDLAARGQCSDSKIKAMCQDSCKECGYQLQGKCENIAGDCDERAKRGECDSANTRTAAWVQTNCRKSCNSCNFNAGPCNNDKDDQFCLDGALHGKCESDAQNFKNWCRKTCNSCEYGVEGNCENIPAWEASCYWWGKLGQCEDNKGYAYPFCPKSCNRCEFAKNPPCEDLSDSCADWKEREQCVLNAIYMSTHCPKTCNTCHKLKQGACENLETDQRCEYYKRNGQCGKPGYKTDQNCRRSCGDCQAPPLNLGNRCEDISRSCDVWSRTKQCESNPEFMAAFCPRSCNKC